MTDTTNGTHGKQDGFFSRLADNYASWREPRRRRIEKHGRNNSWVRPAIVAAIPLAILFQLSPLGQALMEHKKQAHHKECMEKMDKANKKAQSTFTEEEFQATIKSAKAAREERIKQGLPPSEGKPAPTNIPTADAIEGKSIKEIREMIENKSSIVSKNADESDKAVENENKGKVFDRFMELFEKNNQEITKPENIERPTAPKIDTTNTTRMKL